MYTSQTFVKILDNSDLLPDLRSQIGPGLIQIFASWCGHCQDSKPYWERLAQVVAENQSALKIMALDESTANPVLMKELGVQGFPSYFVVDSTGRITQGTGVAQRPDNLVMALVKRM